MGYRESVFINEKSIVAWCCLFSVIFGRVEGIGVDGEGSDKSMTLASTIDGTASTSVAPALATPSYYSCANWTSAPEAEAGNCTRLSRSGIIRCYGGMNNLKSLASQKVGMLFSAQQMVLCGWSQDAFEPPSELKRFPKLRTLTIEYSNFTKIPFEFPDMFHLQTINISWTNLTYISSRTFKHIYALRVLDLRWNQLIQMEGPLILPRTFQQLYLAGNPWNCTRNFKWLLLQPEKGRLVADREEVICVDKKYKECPMMRVMNYKVLLRRECQTHVDLQNCSCLLHHVLPKCLPLYTVNCSHLQFHHLPSYLPENTTSLYINDNLITDVNPLRENPHYRSVVDVQLENNRVSNVDLLEDTDWLQNFRMLNLRGNLLRRLQVYALDNALNDNRNADLLLLSRNPWHCTCKFGMRLRELLTKYKNIVGDAWNVSCTYMQDDELHQAMVLSVTLQDMCRSDAESDMIIHPLDWLNVVLASLIVLILGKLAYDYYFYKYHGRVPWIVMKMP